MKPAVSVIIPTYNGQTLLKNNLPILFDALSDGDEVVVVDDASTDETVIQLLNQYKLEKVLGSEVPEVPKNYFPAPSESSVHVYNAITRHKTKKIHITLIINAANLRFAASCNVGVAFAQNDWIFLLNNDVKVDSSCLDNLKKIATNENRLFAVGCIEYSDSAKLDPSGKNKLWFEKGIFMHSMADDFESGETAWASGGSALFAKDKWLALEGFDQKFYPAYWEDIDISYRAKLRGWKVLFEPTAIVYHKHETTNANVLGLQRIRKMSWKHSQYFTWKHTTISQKLEVILWSPYWVLKRFIASQSL